jgi:hypothetical protein
MLIAHCSKHMQMSQATVHAVLHAAPAVLHDVSHQLWIFDPQPGARPRNLRKDMHTNRQGD